MTAISFKTRLQSAKAFSTKLVLRYLQKITYIEVFYKKPVYKELYTGKGLQRRLRNFTSTVLQLLETLQIC